jgi:hypothetical protein
MLFIMDGKSKVEPKFRKQLNQGQINILTYIYRFRFGTTELLANSLGMKSGRFVHPRLATLVEQGFVGRRFDGSYHLRNKHASYYLLPKALRILQTITKREDIDNTTIKSSYKDKTASDQFITHNLAIYAIHNQLKSLYPAIKHYTKRELNIHDYLEYFPKPLPDAFISLMVGDERRRFFLELFEDSIPSFVFDRRLRKLINYYQNKSWAVTKSPFPPILCVCESGRLEKRLRRQISRALYSSDTEMFFYTTTQPALLGSSKGDDKIWSSSSEPEKLYSLETLPVNP